MNINLSSKEIGLVTGGINTLDIQYSLLNQFLSEFRESKESGNKEVGFEDINRCVNVVSRNRGFMLCVPVRKPLSCRYDLWGMLHDLDIELARC